MTDIIDCSKNLNLLQIKHYILKNTTPLSPSTRLDSCHFYCVFTTEDDQYTLNMINEIKKSLINDNSIPIYYFTFKELNINYVFALINTNGNVISKSYEQLMQIFPNINFLKFDCKKSYNRYIKLKCEDLMIKYTDKSNKNNANELNNSMIYHTILMDIDNNDNNIHNNQEKINNKTMNSFDIQNNNSNDINNYNYLYDKPDINTDNISYNINDAELNDKKYIFKFDEEINKMTKNNFAKMDLLIPRITINISDVEYIFGMDSQDFCITMSSKIKDLEKSKNLIANDAKLESINNNSDFLNNEKNNELNSINTNLIYLDNIESTNNNEINDILLKEINNISIKPGEINNLIDNNNSKTDNDTNNKNNIILPFKITENNMNNDLKCEKELEICGFNTNNNKDIDCEKIINNNNMLTQNSIDQSIVNINLNDEQIEILKTFAADHELLSSNNNKLFDLFTQIYDGIINEIYKNLRTMNYQQTVLHNKTKECLKISEIFLNIINNNFNTLINEEKKVTEDYNHESIINEFDNKNNDLKLNESNRKSICRNSQSSKEKKTNNSEHTKISNQNSIKEKIINGTNVNFEIENINIQNIQISLNEIKEIKNENNQEIKKNENSPRVSNNSKEKNSIEKNKYTDVNENNIKSNEEISNEKKDESIKYENKTDNEDKYNLSTNNQSDSKGKQQDNEQLLGKKTKKRARNRGLL